MRARRSHKMYARYIIAFVLMLNVPVNLFSDGDRVNRERSSEGEAKASDFSVSNQALYHRDTAIPKLH